ncbi:MAG: hypothetical protein K5656_02205 [Lachnospiraceae bacterium]|nr:hypothetical protein [Lachnospiraceae bacterium]
MSENEAKKAKIYEIYCPSCGAAAHYDIKSHVYSCQHCGGKVKIDKAINNNKGFQKIQKSKMNQSLKNFNLEKASCTGCGAEVVFEKGEAVANCAFCGKSLVRSEFVNADSIPELVIPFSITLDEAKEILEKWCKKNSAKKEAKKILKKTSEIKGCYLPYELVRGPVDCQVSRIENGGKYDCGGFVDEVFINCSNNLDNHLLDGMEPYNLDEITEFDFAFVAGHQVKVRDVTADEFAKRTQNEIKDNYMPVIQKTLEAKAVYVDIDSKDVLRMPVLLPVYYLSFDGYMAAVNGQTGKVSVRAAKESHYVVLPWWIKAIMWTVIATGIIALATFLFGMKLEDIKVLSGCAAFVILMALLTAYSQTMNNGFIMKAARKIFTSKGGPYVRNDGRLEQANVEYKKEKIRPLFFMNLDGNREVVELKFTSALRVFMALILALLLIFLPVIFALIINGFNFSSLELGGSAVWFCIFVPVTPIALIKFGRIEIYDNPWIYIVDDEGKKKRYKEKKQASYTPGEIAVGILKALFIPPGCIGVWALIGVFITMVYLTAFGFD